MKRKVITCLIVLLLTAALALSCAACGTSGSSGASSAPDTTAGDASAKSTELNIRIPDSFATLDPHNWNLDSDCRTCRQIYEPLYELDEDGNEIPVLASGYTVSEDGLTVVFTLIDNAYFTNGDKLTASDVKYSIDRARNSAYLSSNVAAIESVDADDAAGTVTLNLSSPTPGLITGLSLIYVVSEKFTEENKDENGLLGFNTCGTGPFMLKEYTSDVSITLSANPDYRSGEAAIKTLNFYLIVDENTAQNAFQAGDLDISVMTSSNWENIKADPAYSTVELTTNHITYIIFNNTVAPLDNKLVREALSCATNRDDLITMVMDGFAVPAYTLATSLMTGYGDIEPGYTYDPERAKELLTEAGYPDGIDLGEIQALSGTYFAGVAEVLMDQWAQAGITCTITNLEANTLIANAMGGSFSMATMGQTNAYDMTWLDTYYHTKHIGSMNMAQYSDPNIDARLEEAGVCLDSEARAELYQGIMQDMDEEMVYLPLYNKIKCIAWNADLNYTPSIRIECFYDCSWN